MLNRNRLEEMSGAVIDAMDTSDLVDVERMKIDKNLPLCQRMEQYTNQIKNPYCFRSGKIKVKITFTPDGDSLDNILTKFFTGLKGR